MRVQEERQQQEDEEEARAQARVTARLEQLRASLLEVWRGREERERLRQQLAAEEQRRQAEEELGREGGRVRGVYLFCVSAFMCGSRVGGT